MPAAQFSYENFVAASQATANAAETVICTTRTVSSAYAGSAFGIVFSGSFLAGAGTTSVIFQIRETSLTGTSILTSGALSIGAAARFAVYFACTDAIVGESSGAVWVLTAAQTAGTAPGGFTNGFSSVTTPV
jgi:hypothetical protein